MIRTLCVCVYGREREEEGGGRERGKDWDGLIFCRLSGQGRVFGEVTFESNVKE